jgi:hypothetical protein
VRAPGREEERDEEGPVAKRPPDKKSGSIPTGAVGLVLAIIFFAGIVVSPGGLYSVMFGGVLGFAGLVISIIGIATRSGRVAGVFGIVFFLLGWVVNTVAIGRL